MSHLGDDVQIFLVLAGGGSLASLAVCRVKYGEDWFDAWFTLTKTLCILALVIIAVGEHALLYRWWAAAPILVSMSLLSALGWLVARWTLGRLSKGAIVDLELGGAMDHSTNHGKPSHLLLYWGLASIFLLILSVVVAIRK